VPIEGVLLDIEGVLTVSWEPLPGAAEGLAGLRSDEVPFRLLTNTTELTRAQVRERLASAGLAVAAEEIVTAPLLTAAHLRDEHPGARCHLLAAPGIVEDLEGVDLDGEEASVVVVGGSTEPFTVEQMRLALRLVLGGAALVAMHRSAAWMTAQGMTLDAGVMLVAGLEEATGRKAVVCGKPARECFERSAALIGVTPARTAMVGDDIANDILAGQAAGLTGVLVRTGRYRPEDLERGIPDHAIDSVADLPALLRRLRA